MRTHVRIPGFPRACHAKYAASYNRLMCTSSVAHLQALPNGTVIDHSFPNSAWHGHKVLQVDPANSLLHVPLGAPCIDCPLDIAFGNISYGGKQQVHCSERCLASRQCALVYHAFYMTSADSVCYGSL